MLNQAQGSLGFLPTLELLPGPAKSGPSLGRQWVWGLPSSSGKGLGRRQDPSELALLGGSVMDQVWRQRQLTTLAL